MRIFIAWSKGVSKEIGEALKAWLLEINCAVFFPVISSENIEIGSQWHNSLDAELQKADFGILCVTEENLDSAWLCYESGVLGTSTAKNDKAKHSPHVAPILFGNIDKSRIADPIRQFQSISFEEDKMLSLVLQLNAYSRLVNPNPQNFLDESDIMANFGRTYPALEKKIQDILRAGSPVVASKRQTVETDHTPDTPALDEFDAAVMDKFDAALKEFQRYESVDDAFKRLSKMGNILSTSIRKEGIREDYRQKAQQYQNLLQRSQVIARNPTQAYALQRLSNALSALL